MFRLILFIHYLCALRLVSCSNFDVTAIRGCLSAMTYFREWYDVTLKQCVIECSMRERCTYLTYRPALFRLCRLSEGTFPGYVTSDAGKGTCIYVSRADMNDMAAPCSCPEKMTCHTATGDCVIEECDYMPPDIPNGNIIGNTNSVGSRVKVVCDEGYTELRNVQYVWCNADGTWSHDPICINGKIITCDDRCDGSSYLLVTQASSRTDAMITCASTGGYLAKVTTEAEHTFLAQEMLQFQGDFWIGLDRLPSTTQWQWTDGSTVGFTKWAAGEPNGANDNCARMKFGSEFYWADRSCTRNYFFICEYSDWLS